jgi:hypothetical protein
MENISSLPQMEGKNILTDDIVDVIIKSDTYQYTDLKNRNIQKLKNILYSSKSPNEARLLLNLKNDFTPEEEDFYCHETYWKSLPNLPCDFQFEITSENSYQSFMKNITNKSLSCHDLNKNFLEDQSKDFSISDVLTNPMILKECGKHLYFFLRKRKLLKIIDETNITHCDNCKSTFTMIYRKHHCRSCGKIFCSQCCWKKIEVPKEFLSYQQSSIFSYFSKEERVCDQCYIEIYEYHTCKILVEFFKIIGLEIPLLQRCATLTKNWRKAVLFYLSFIREIQYKLLHINLDEYEQRFLYSNRYILLGHSSWVLQLYKLPSTENFLNRKISNCWDCMCSRLCHNELDIFDAFIVLILENKYSKNIQLKGLEILKSNKENKWLYFLPFFFSRWSGKDSETENNTEQQQAQQEIKNELDMNSNLFDWLIELAKTKPKIFSILYWGFSVSSFSKSRRIYEQYKEKLILEIPDFSKTFIKILGLLGLCENFFQHKDINKLKYSLSKLNNCYCPINPQRKINKILVEEIKIKSSITTPIYIPYECDDGTRSAILFKREDIRKDATAMAMAKLCQNLLENNGISVPFVCYDVVPTSPTSGFIEIVQKSKTLHEIFQEGTINNYLQIHNPEKKIGEILDNYMKSLAFWTVFTYLLGVGDRHLENIMLTSEGILFHIDYSFIVGYETKPYVPLIRIDNSMIEGIGGNVQYDKFKSMCVEMFLCLRRYSSLLFCCFLTFASCDPPIQNTKFTLELLENHVVDRFLLGQTESDVSFTLSKLLDTSRDAVTLKVTDYIHTYASKMPTKQGLFSWFSKK